jgi:hypothetical protein
MKTAVLIGLGSLIGSAVWAGPALLQPEAREIRQILDAIAGGRDSVFGPAVAPAMSLDEKASPALRVQQIDARIAEEIDRVLGAFMNAPEAQKIAATRAAVAQRDKETATDGASRTFEGGGPSLSVMRQFLFIPADQVHASDPVARVTDIISSFERSPKTDDNYFEYSNPRDLAGSTITKLPGSKSSWSTSPRPSMAQNTLYALKKCRQIVLLGWYCNTAYYAVRDLPSEQSGRASVLLTVLHPLKKGQDNSAFTTGQAENIVDGYTAVYLIKRSGNLILVYNLGIQYKTSAPSQTSRLNEGQKAEYRQLVSRLKADLGIAALP